MRSVNSKSPSPDDGSYMFHATRRNIESEFFEYYRCYSHDQEVVLSGRAKRFGKPIPVFTGMDEGDPVIVISNASGYLINGRTEIRELASDRLLGSYTRLGAVLDVEGNKLARWRDARKWSEEFRENLVDALANALLGAGDVPAGANPGDTQLLSSGKQLYATLQRQRLGFFPDPPKSESPGKISKLAGRVLPGELGRSLREHLPPYGWVLTISKAGKARFDSTFLLCVALIKLEMMRWSRSA